MASEPTGRWGEYHVIRLPDGTEIRFPEPLHDRVREGLNRRRERVVWAEGDGLLVAIGRAYHGLYARYGARPTILSMTEADYRALLKEPSIGPILGVTRTAYLSSLLNMWIERRPDDDLPHVVWVEIVTVNTP